MATVNRSFADAVRGFTVIETIEEYDAMLEAHCLPEDETEIEGVGRHARFEELESDNIQALSNWFLEHGGVYVIRITSKAMALHIFGTSEAERIEDPSLKPANLQFGKGKDQVEYYWSPTNQHNRYLKARNLGDPDKEGLTFDMLQGYFVLGPAAHIDAWGGTVSIQHRLAAKIEADKINPETQPIELLTIVGIPTPLVATLDRGAAKSKKDQEVMDVDKFEVEWLTDRLKLVARRKTDTITKCRDTLSSWLTTVRNNLYSRRMGTGYHPGGNDTPSTRQAIELEKEFEPSSDGERSSLEELLVDVFIAHLEEDGSKAGWTKQFPPAMVAAAIVLYSNRDWAPSKPIKVDPEIRDFILEQMSSNTEKTATPVGCYMAEINKVKALTKKPSPMDKWTFHGLISCLNAALLGDDYDMEEHYFERSGGKDKEGNERPPKTGYETKWFPNETLMQSIRKQRKPYNHLHGLDREPELKTDK